MNKRQKAIDLRARAVELQRGPDGKQLPYRFVPWELVDDLCRQAGELDQEHMYGEDA